MTPLVVTTVSTPFSKPSLSAAYHTATTTKAPLTILSTAIKIIREEGGIRGLYRGLVPTAVGVAPYVGLYFSTYELLRGYITPPGK